MIRQLKSGSWVISGVGPLSPEEHQLAIAEGAVLVSNAEMQAFIHEEVRKHTEHALKILIEHQRHALLPEQSEGHDK